MSTDTLPDSNLSESAEELYEMAPCGYLTTVLDGRIVKVNKTLSDWLGYKPEELTGGKKLVDLLTPGGRIFYETHLNLLLRVQTAVDEIALDLVRKTGGVLPALINARQKRNEAGEPVLNRFTVFNSSERRMYERDLLAARDLLRITLSSIGDAVIATDPEGFVNFMNPVAEDLSGWQNEAALGKPIDDVLILVSEDNDELVENPIRYALRTGTTIGLSNQTILIAKDGRRISIDDSASPIRHGDGEVVGGVLVFRDISGRRNNERMALARIEELHDTARLESLGVMAGGIAHDFNNLLTGILGYATLLRNSVTGRNADFANEIVIAGERAAGLAGQMLAYSGKGWLEIRNLDLNAYLQENLTLLLASLAAGVRVDVEYGPAGYVIAADTAQVHQVIMNLLTNASEAIGSEPGRILIRTSVTEQKAARFSPILLREVAPGTFAVLEIRDTGTGIAPNILRKIFDPFFTTKFTGRGLGLSAVLGIVKGHRGDIEVISEPNVGSTFRVFLPAFVPAAAKSVPPTNQPIALAETETILIVDDEEVIRKLASLAFKAHGIRVVLAENGAQALAALEAEPSISAVVLDLTMPVMSGEEALPLIRSMRPNLPIIISSGFSEAEIARRFASSGVNGVLSKPYTATTIVSKVTNAIHSRQD